MGESPMRPPGCATLAVCAAGAWFRAAPISNPRTGRSRRGAIRHDPPPFQRGESGQMRKFVPLLVTAFAGAVPARGPLAITREAPRESESREERGEASRRGASAEEESESGDRSCLACLDGARADLARLAGDALLHWRQESREAASARRRWEARRRALVCEAWISGRRASLDRLRGLSNPHRLTLAEIRLEFGADGTGA